MKCYNKSTGKNILAFQHNQISRSNKVFNYKNLQNESEKHFPHLATHSVDP